MNTPLNPQGPSKPGIKAIQSCRRSAAVLGITLIAAVSANAQIIFSDDYSRPDLVPPSASAALAGTSPQVGDPYSGGGNVLDSAQAAGNAALAASALGGGNIVQALGTNGRWWISSDSQLAAQSQTVSFSFDFYMVNTAATEINVVTFTDGGFSGRGWDIVLRNDGSISWYDGSFHHLGETFDTGQKQTFSIVADFSQGTYVANIGSLSFNGNMTIGTNTFASVLFYNSTGSEFYYNNAEIKIGAIPEPESFVLFCTAAISVLYLGRRRRNQFSIPR